MGDFIPAAINEHELLQLEEVHHDKISVINGIDLYYNNLKKSINGDSLIAKEILNWISVIAKETKLSIN